ncbi:MAG: peptidoglycan DD-metalloendopeptidase family protein [Muribaculaceae bacterium]|nr:peptidoglycan DD-metalloendopeptidase family protein [Muribaculaceae bacterium]
MPDSIQLISNFKETRKLISLFLLALIFIFPSYSKTISPSKPKTSAEAKKRQADTQKEIKLTEEQIRQNESQVKRSLSELGKIDQEITSTNNKITTLNTKISSLNTEISSLETGIANNERDLETLREEYLKAVKKMRVTRKNKSTLAFIFSSKSVSQAMRRMRYLREFSTWRNKKTDEIHAKTTDLKNQRDALAKAKEEQASTLALQKNNMTQLAKQHSQQEAIVADLKKNGAALQSHLKKKQAEAKELGNIVSQLIAEEQRKAAEEETRRREAEAARRKAEEEEKQRLLAQENKTSENKKDSKPSEYAEARKRASRKQKSQSEVVSEPIVTGDKSFAEMQGKLPYPSTGSFSITSPFGRQYLPDLPDIEYDNPGIDAETEPGASARAVYKGKVSGVYLLPGYNTVVILNHGNYYTVYGNISSPMVKNGDSVESGTLLGKLALDEDDSSHSSIHFEVWKNREKLNPQVWLR